MIKNRDIMLNTEQFPIVAETSIFKETLEKMSLYNLGAACVIGSQNNLTGIITDGDIRRKLLNVQKPFSAFFVDDTIDHAIKNPIYSHPETSVKETLSLMTHHQIWDLPIVDDNNNLVGLVHLHPAIKNLIENI